MWDSDGKVVDDLFKFVRIRDIKKTRLIFVYFKRENGPGFVYFKTVFAKFFPYISTSRVLLVCHLALSKLDSLCSQNTLVQTLKKRD